jgi:predicted site-specific integrase-resolvase
MMGLPCLLRRGRVLEVLGVSDYTLRRWEDCGVLERQVLRGCRYGHFLRDDVLKLKQEIEKGSCDVGQSEN